MVRPQEAVAALQQLQQSYDNYFRSVNEYNRAQFRLYRALATVSATEKALVCSMP